LKTATIPPDELGKRMITFCDIMDNLCSDWQTAVILSKVNQFYFTGTMQDGFLLIRKDRNFFYFVRRSYERAMEESPFKPLYKINSYRDAAAIAGTDAKVTYFETEIIPYATVLRFRKYFNVQTVESLDKAVLITRAVKSEYELDQMRISGKMHNELLSNRIPGILREGMSEAEFGTEIFAEMMKLGYQGISRFSMFQTEMVTGQIGFGENSIYPTSFDGPGGARGLGTFAPVLGSRERRLKKGDLVFADIAFGMNGYHTDKTQVYLFGGNLQEDIRQAHQQCIEIEKQIADLLRPGAIPSGIYQAIMRELPKEFVQNFMGFGQRQAKFLGHGVGLHIDEYPVLANGYNEPLLPNMTLAVEPKKGICGQGMIGVEDTYAVTESGGQCLTGGGKPIIRI
jgi:Xaa-Pro dipeptidase